MPSTIVLFICTLYIIFIYILFDIGHARSVLSAITLRFVEEVEGDKFGRIQFQ